LLVSLLATAAGAAGPSVRIEPVPPAAQALARLGVVTHLDYGQSPYRDLPRVREALSYLGFVTLRDMTPHANARPYESLAGDGFRFDFVIRRETVDKLPQVVSGLVEFERRHPGSIVAIEGLNEIKIWPARYRGDSSFAGAAAAQCELFRLVNAPGSNLGDVPVLALTLGGASRGDHDRLGDLSDCADLGNAHVYFGTQPPRSSWTFARDLARRATARKPALAVTETGYATSLDGNGVPEDVQATYLLFLALRALRDEVPLTFFYQLVDDRRDPAWSYNTGFYRHDWSPRPAAHGFHRFARLLSGEGPRVADPAALDFSLGGDATDVEHLALQRGDGSVALVLWREVALWDAVTRRHLPTAPRRLTLTTKTARAELADPLAGTRGPLHPVAGGHGIFTLELADRPLVVLLSRESLVTR
jgi:trimeric autotransporter adhesin